LFQKSPFGKLAYATFVTSIGMNDAIPDTRWSLILRLPKPDQQQAWQEFVETYDPFLYRYMRRRGLDDAAARDVVQHVMMSVVRSIEDWKPISGGPRFRNWLFTIARNLLINERIRCSKEVVVGGSTAIRAMQSLSSTLESDDQHAEYRKEAILFAASRIRQQVDAVTWQAFWKTAVEGNDCKSVASELHIQVGSVYAAKSRVLRRVRDQIALMLEYDDEL
jgi:RNA polymerase sigma factor (sigma-70 family)